MARAPHPIWLRTVARALWVSMIVRRAETMWARVSPEIGHGFLAEHGRQPGFEPKRGQQAHQLGGFAQGGVDRGFGAHQLFGAGSRAASVRFMA
jgi:hypothetical protein